MTQRAWGAVALAAGVLTLALVCKPRYALSALAQEPTQTRRPPSAETIEAVTRTATAARLATSGTVTAQVATWTAEALATATVTPTATPTLPPPFSTVDPCVCLTPPPGPSECADIIATLHAGYRSAFATQTALSRGTDTPTAPPSATPSATPTAPTATPTPLPTDEPTPTPALPPTHTPTATLTPWPDACTAGGRTACRVLLPFAYLRRAVRR